VLDGAGNGIVGRWQYILGPTHHCGDDAQPERYDTRAPLFKDTEEYSHDRDGLQDIKNCWGCR